MENLQEIFACNVFSKAVMKEKLPKDTYKKLLKTLDVSEGLTSDVADIVASVMKDWAIEKGATHYTHWFQPMTGKTAEKHDSFIESTHDGKVIMEFSGKQLIQGEPDASSFPTGGLRATFEARGYTTWDATSPAFVKDHTLYIPTAFCSYSGEALDKKTPLLRSMEAISKQAVRILRLFGDTETQKVTPTVGPEQEYFIIDKNLFYQRKDLMYTGRTLFGAKAPKGQELDDHYFAAIKGRVNHFMKDLDLELWKLGVTSKTKHNEVAPAQHEMAPIYTTTNIATDHNQLVMESLVKVADRHGLACLLHEKPFAGINGSGKHNNWSIGTDKVNLLEPGSTPHENAQFLTFLVATIAAVSKFAPLLRLSAASPGNDHRLGANEAPPAIISIFLGEQLTDIIHQINDGGLTSCKCAAYIDLGVNTLSKFKKDVTDRNRTSPFAFTGNKFEFRMLGSTASIAGPNIILNTIVADLLKDIADELEKAEDFNKALSSIIERLVKEHSNVLFDGDGYDESWIQEAEKRGLPNIRTTVEAIEIFNQAEYIELFEKHGVFTESEVLSRQEILFDEYAKTIHIEGLTSIQIVKRQILPATLHYASHVASSIHNIQSVIENADLSAQHEVLAQINSLYLDTSKALATLEDRLAKAQDIKKVSERAKAYKLQVYEAMEDLRKPCDALEEILGEGFWPMPSYGDLLFSL